MDSTSYILISESNLKDFIQSKPKEELVSILYNLHEAYKPIASLPTHLSPEELPEWQLVEHLEKFRRILKVIFEPGPIQKLEFELYKKKQENEKLKQDLASVQAQLATLSQKVGVAVDNIPF